MELSQIMIRTSAQSACELIPLSLVSGEEREIDPPFVSQEVSVLIGVTGDIQGNLLLSGSITAFAEVGESMFGMPLEGDMLISFVGELGNMIAGATSTGLHNQLQLALDITPPTVMMGHTQLGGFVKAQTISLNQDGIEKIQLFFMSR